MNQRVKKRRKSVGARQDDELSGVGYRLLRWPVLAVILAWLGVLTFVYVSIRVYVALYEYAVTWRGDRRQLRQRLREANSYDDWVRRAVELDAHLGLEAWKHRPKFLFYDYRTVQTLVRQLRLSNAHPDPEETATLLQACVKYNFAGTQGQELYSQCYYGTKDIVDQFNSEVVAGLDRMASSSLPLETRRVLFRSFSRNYGKSALALSGGACFAYRHFGVVKTLLEHDLLPNIVSGTSGGGLVAALVCTRTNDELRELLVPELADKITPCWEKFPDWFFRWYRTGARFDSIDWAERCSWFTLGSLTFKEAFERTGKILNISTVPADPHSPVMLLNHITSPHCVIWSALLASAAVPGILNPIVLMMKTNDGRLVPYNFGSKWKDGSLRTDIPLEALHSHFNVTFSIVSQVNPHVALFIYAPRGTVGRPVSHRRGKGWRGGFVGSVFESMVKLELRKWLKLMKTMDLLPRIMDQDWSNVWLQRFDGTVTVWPKIKVRDLWGILSDPSREELAEMMLAGERSTYPKLLYIRHFVNIERAIERGRRVSSRTHASRMLLNKLSDMAYHSDSAGDLDMPRDDAMDYITAESNDSSSGDE